MLSLILSGCSNEESTPTKDDKAYKEASSSIIFEGDNYKSIENLKKQIGYLYLYAESKDDVNVKEVESNLAFNPESLMTLYLNDTKYKKDISDYANQNLDIPKKEFTQLADVDLQRVKELYLNDNYSKITEDILDNIAPITQQDTAKYTKDLDKNVSTIVVIPLESKSEKDIPAEREKAINKFEKLNINKLSNGNLVTLSKQGYDVLNLNDLFYYSDSKIKALGLPSYIYGSEVKKDTDDLEIETTKSIYTKKFRDSVQEKKLNEWVTVKASKKNRDTYIKNPNNEKGFVGDFIYKVIEKSTIDSTDLKHYAQSQKFRETFYNEQGYTTLRDYNLELLTAIDKDRKDLAITQELYEDISKSLEKANNDKAKKSNDSVKWTEEVGYDSVVDYADYLLSQKMTPYYSQEYIKYVSKK